jgi:hypothetical protein
MKQLQIRKNFIFDRQLVEEAQKVLKKRYGNMTQAFTQYLKAVVKDPEILEKIEESASKREGRFIGMLDGKIGAGEYKRMRDSFYQSGKKFR